LKKLLKEDPVKILYDKLLLIIKYASVYKELDLFFQGASRRTLSEIEEESQKYQKLEMDHQTKTSRLEKIQEESLSLQTRSLEAKHELETILEDIKILEENMVFHEQKSILDAQKHQKEKEQAEVNEQLLSIRSQYERIKIQKTEWNGWK
jgi:chromosome segregation ATPase